MRIMEFFAGLLTPPAVQFEKLSESALAAQIEKMFDKLEIAREVVLETTDLADFPHERGQSESWLLDSDNSAYFDWVAVQRKVIFARRSPHVRVGLIAREVRVLLGQIELIRCDSEERETVSTLFEALRGCVIPGRIKPLDRPIEGAVEDLKWAVDELLYHACLTRTWLERYIGVGI